MSFPDEQRAPVEKLSRIKRRAAISHWRKLSHSKNVGEDICRITLTEESRRDVCEPIVHCGNLDCRSN